MSVAVRLADPLLPTLRVVMLLSRRLIWPSFRTEPYLQVNDLARAIELSTDDSQLIGHEQQVLRNLVSLSDLRVDECMRPRAQLPRFRPPLHWREQEAELQKLDYVFVTEDDSDEVVGTLDLREFWQAPGDHLERLAQKALYAPWCAKVADVLQLMESRDRHAVVVVNELGETIGAITRSDILDIVFTSRSTRSERLLNREPIQALTDDLWQATGLSNLRVLAEQFAVELPETGSVTIAGVIQETLQRLPQVGDQVAWGSFLFEVTEANEGEPIVVRLRRREMPEDER
jgi:CBS domain containing-hemolysin-like protein